LVINENGYAPGKTSRKDEWPKNADEFLNYHGMEREFGTIEITYEGMESHLETYAAHKVSQSQRKIFATLRQVRGGLEVIEHLKL